MANVMAWARSIPRIEWDQPLVVCEGRGYTVNEIVQESHAGTAIGQKLERIIETRNFTDIKDEYGLAVERVRERLSALPDTMVIASIAGAQYSPSAALKEVESGTKLGRALIDAEIARVKEVLERSR